MPLAGCLAGASPAPRPAGGAAARSSGQAVRPVLVGSMNALPGMRTVYPGLLDGAEPLDAALAVVAPVEADPTDTSVGLGGLPNAEGRVQLDAACMHAPTHNSGAVAALENILHPSQVARLVMERTDHCLLVGRGAYDFARMHGHAHTELLTDNARRAWVRWCETRSAQDDYLPPAADKQSRAVDFGADPDGALLAYDSKRGSDPWHGTIHCSAVARNGDIACTTTTSGLPFKIPGRVGDSPIIGAGLYCDQEAGSAGATGRGESAILSNGSFAAVELMRQGASPEEAGLEVLRRITRQAQRAASWQPALVDDGGVPRFGIHFYLVNTAGDWAGVTLRGQSSFAVADPEGGPRLEKLISLHG